MSIKSGCPASATTPQGPLALSGDVLGCHGWGGGGGCAAGIERPGTRLNVLQHSGKSPRQRMNEPKTIVAPGGEALISP